MKREILLISSLLALWCAFPESALAITSEPSTVTYVDEAGNRRIYAFARGNGYGPDGLQANLVVNYWDGFNWHWADLGRPAGSSYVGNVSAITYVDSSGHRRIYAFVTTSSGQLAVKYWNGFQWQWANQGLPPGSGSVSRPVAITYGTRGGLQQIYVFCVGSDSHLVVNYWDGSSWHWADLGVPPQFPSGKTWTDLDAVTYLDDTGHRRIDVFAVGYGLDMWARSWNGTSWSWTNHGNYDRHSVSAITYLDELGDRRTYAFVTGGGSDSLRVRYLQGFWQTADLGLPQGTTAVLYVSAITYVDGNGNRRMHAFTRGGSANVDGHLYVKSFVDANQYWADQGLAPGDGFGSPPDAITYVDGAGKQRIYVFGQAFNGHLVVKYWDGDSWHWADQGTL